MLQLNQVHHVAIICSDYQKSKTFYAQVPGLTILNETYREARQSYKLDLAVNGRYAVELFSFPDRPERLSRPEGRGLRHIAFEVDDIAATAEGLKEYNIIAEPVRVDENTHKKFTFIADPDKLPIEFYEK